MNVASVWVPRGALSTSSSMARWTFCEILDAASVVEPGPRESHDVYQLTNEEVNTKIIWLIFNVSLPFCRHSTRPNQRMEGRSNLEAIENLLTRNWIKLLRSYTIVHNSWLVARLALKLSPPLHCSGTAVLMVPSLSLVSPLSVIIDSSCQPCCRLFPSMLI